MASLSVPCPVPFCPIQVVSCPVTSYYSVSSFALVCPLASWPVLYVLSDRFVSCPVLHSLSLSSHHYLSCVDVSCIFLAFPVLSVPALCVFDYPFFSCTVGAFTLLSIPVLFCPSLSSVLSFPVVAWSVMSRPVVGCNVRVRTVLPCLVIYCPVLPCLAQACPVLCYPVISCLVQVYLVLFYTVASSRVSSPVLSIPII